MWAVSNSHYVTLSRNELPDEDTGQWDWNLPAPRLRKSLNGTVHTPSRLPRGHWAPPVSPASPLCSFFHKSPDPWTRSAFLCRQPGICRQRHCSFHIRPHHDCQRAATSSESPPQTSLLRWNAHYLPNEIVFSLKSCTCCQKWRTGSRKDFHHEVSQWPLPSGNVDAWNPFMSSTKT